MIITDVSYKFHWGNISITYTATAFILSVFYSDIIKPDDIQACHRLLEGKNHCGPMKVIARFVNRKTSETLIRCNKKLAHRDIFEKAGLHEKIYIDNSLSDYNKYLWGKANKALLQKNLFLNFVVF